MFAVRRIGKTAGYEVVPAPEGGECGHTNRGWLVLLATLVCVTMLAAFMALVSR